MCLAVAPALAGAGVDREIYPPNPDIYLSINNIDGIRDGIEVSPAGKLWAEPTLDPVKESANQAFEDLINIAVAQKRGAPAPGESAQTDPDLIRLKAIAAALTQGLEDLKDLSAAAYITPAEPGAELDQTRTDVYIAATLEGETLRAIKEVLTEGIAEDLPFPWNELDKIVDQNLKEKKEVKITKLADDAILVTSTDEADPIVAICGNRLFIGTSHQDDPNDWAQKLAKGKPAKNWIDPAKERYGGNADEPKAVVLAKTDAVWAILDGVSEQLKQASPEKFSQITMVRKALESAGLADIESFAAKWTVGEEGFRTRAELETSDEPRGFLNMGENAAFEIGKWVPEGTVTAFESQGRSLRDFYSEFRTAIEDIAGIGALSAMDSVFDRFKVQTGIDVHQDVLLNLGGHLVGWETSASLAGPMQVPPLLLAWEVGDAPAMLDVIERLTGMTPPNLALMTQDHEFDGLKFKTVGVATFPLLMPAYGAIDDMMVVASSAKAFEMTVKTYNDGGNKEIRNKIKDAFKDAGLPYKGVSMSYTDIADSVEQIPTQCAQVGAFLPIWMMMMSSQMSQNPEAQQAVQSAMTTVAKILQSLTQVDSARLASHLNPIVSVMYVEEGKIVSERLSSIPDMALAAGGVGVSGAAILGVRSAKKAAMSARTHARATRPQPAVERVRPERPSPAIKTETADLTVGKEKTVGDIVVRVDSVVFDTEGKKVKLTVAGKDGQRQTYTVAEGEVVRFQGIRISPETILAGDEGRGRAKIKISPARERPARRNR